MAKRFKYVPQLMGIHNPTAVGSFVVVAAAMYCHPDDVHLAEVLCYDEGRNYWVIWTYNTACPGFSNGRYFEEDAVAAYKAFGELVATKGRNIDVRSNDR